MGLTLAGVALAQTDRFLDRNAGDALPFRFDLGLSPGLIAYVAGLAVIGSAIVGVLPALKATGRRVQAGLQQRVLRMTAIGVIAVTLSVLLLSAAGIYAMMSFTVARRRREIGIRAALGAGPRHVLASILGRATAQLGIGVVVGLALAAALESATDGSIMGGKSFILLPIVSALMTSVGLLAALGPARRGLSVQPTEALREE